MKTILLFTLLLLSAVTVKAKPSERAVVAETVVPAGVDKV